MLPNFRTADYAMSREEASANPPGPASR